MGTPGGTTVSASRPHERSTASAVTRGRAPAHTGAGICASPEEER